MPARKNTDDIPQNGAPARPIDATDRKILGELAKQADLSYTELGDRIGLSPPATHERVKRLKAQGRIKSTAAMIDANAIGKPLLAFVHVDTAGWGKSPEMLALSALPEVEELHSVTGDACVLLKVRVADPQALEGLLHGIYELPGVRGTRTYVVLSTYVERPVQAGITPDLALAPHDGPPPRLTDRTKV